MYMYEPGYILGFKSACILTSLWGTPVLEISGRVVVQSSETTKNISEQPFFSKIKDPGGREKRTDNPGIIQSTSTSSCPTI